jgi:hypothetical protein
MANQPTSQHEIAQRNKVNSYFGEEMNGSPNRESSSTAKSDGRA